MQLEGTDLPVWGMEIDPDEAKERFRASSAKDGGKVGSMILMHIEPNRTPLSLGSECRGRCKIRFAHTLQPQAKQLRRKDARTSKVGGVRHIQQSGVLCTSCLPFAIHCWMVESRHLMHRGPGSLCRARCSLQGHQPGCLSFNALAGITARC